MRGGLNVNGISSLWKRRLLRRNRGSVPALGGVREAARRVGFAAAGVRARAAACLIAAVIVAVGAASSFAAEPRRILSISPASTEIAYDLGLGDRVVGVTAYCSWPPEAKSKMNMGDMMYANMEVIASLRPDLVLLSNMNEHLRGQIEAFGFPVEVVYQDNFEQICESMLRVGKACGIEDAARSRVGELRAAVREISERVGRGSGARPRVMVVVGRDMDDTSFKRVYVAGPKSFYETLLGEAGASNVVTQPSPYVNITREGLIRLDPDIVIELIGEHGMSNIATPEIMAQWKSLDMLRAVREGGVAIIRGDFAMRAGPRYPKLLGAFARVINDGAREVTE
jgi:iron complex transport system substrate-binding protein